MRKDINHTFGSQNLCTGKVACAGLLSCCISESCFTIVQDKFGGFARLGFRKASRCNAGNRLARHRQVLMNNALTVKKCRHCTFNVILRLVRATSGAVAKAISVTYDKPWVSNMQCACAILLSVACPALFFFPHYFMKGTILKKKLLSIKCVF